MALFFAPNPAHILVTPSMPTLFDERALPWTLHEPTREYGPLLYQPEAVVAGSEPADTIRALLDADVPLCATCAVALPGLARDDRAIHEERVLALLAQTDPVLLARVLCLANSGASRGHVDTAGEALRAVGAAQVSAAMRELMVESPGAPWREIDDLRETLLARSIAMGLTARRVSRYLGLARPDATMLYVAGLLDGLGLLAVLHVDAPAAATLVRALQPIAHAPGIALRELAAASGYWLLSTRLARNWDAPQPVVRALEHPDSDAGRLLRACEALIIAKASRRSQRDALERLVPDAKPAVQPDCADIDVAFLPEH